MVHHVTIRVVERHNEEKGIQPYEEYAPYILASLTLAFTLRNSVSIEIGPKFECAQAKSYSAVQNYKILSRLCNIIMARAQSH